MFGTVGLVAVRGGGKVINPVLLASGTADCGKPTLFCLGGSVGCRGASGMSVGAHGDIFVDAR